MSFPADSETVRKGRCAPLTSDSDFPKKIWVADRDDYPGQGGPSGFYVSPQAAYAGLKRDRPGWEFGPLSGPDEDGDWSVNAVRQVPLRGAIHDEQEHWDIYEVDLEGEL